MPSEGLINLCQAPSYVFQSFDTLYECYSIRDSLPDFNKTVNTCLTDYCKAPNPNLKGCPTDNATSLAFSIHRHPWTYFSDQNGYCSNVNTSANTDIGGPGVRQSHLHTNFTFSFSITGILLILDPNRHAMADLDGAAVFQDHPQGLSPGILDRSQDQPQGIQRVIRAAQPQNRSIPR